MELNDFIALVGHRAGLGSRAEARRATRVTLEVLAERLDPAGVSALAAALPAELSRSLRTTGVDHFAPDEFVQRVSHRDGVNDADAGRRVRAVLGVLRDAIDAEAFRAVSDVLPEEYRGLLEGDHQFA